MKEPDMPFMDSSAYPLKFHLNLVFSRRDGHSYKIGMRMGPKQVTPEPDPHFPKRD
jgi:hypothetical protein